MNELIKSAQKYCCDGCHYEGSSLAECYAIKKDENDNDCTSNAGGFIWVETKKG